MSTIQDDPGVNHAPLTSELANTPPAPRPPLRRRGSRRDWVVAAVVVVVLVVAGLASVPPGTPGHLLWTRLVGDTPVGLAVGAPQSQADPQVAAIQQVIQRGNAEQAQALAAQDPSVMSDTATAAYYRQLVQLNQQLLAQGVTGIQLTNLTWGPISVSGTTATVTTDETWVTTFSDSITAESTDMNIYTLVQQNGTWLIEADQQATSGQQPAAQPTPGPSGQSPQPTVARSAATSQNWSGYAATGGTFTGVGGTWSVPQPSSSTAIAGVGATWVGIGGVSSQDLIQAGTQDVTAGGQHEFQAWIELLPQASQQVPLAVAPGDSITVSITESSPGSGTWQISLQNNTSGQSYQTTVQYRSSQSSAEWIEEAPAGGNGSVIEPLDNFGTVPFSAATAVENGQTVDLAQAGARSITMLNAANPALAVPSAIGSDGSSFSVTRTSAPATTGRGGGIGRRGRNPAGVGR